MATEPSALDVGIERQTVCAHLGTPFGSVCTCPFCKNRKVIVWQRKDVPWVALMHSTACPHVVRVFEDADHHWFVEFERKTKVKGR